LKSKEKNVKYIVKGENDAIIASYEKNSKRGWDIFEPDGPPYLRHDSASQQQTIIEAVLDEHRKKGRQIIQED
jgi:hypothetical protein